MASTMTSPDLDERTTCRTLTRELPRDLRDLRVEVLRETLANGVPVSPLALTVVLSSLDDVSDEPLLLTALALEELVWFGIEAFCTDLGLPVPEGCGAALHATLATATRLELLAPESDPTTELFAALRALGAR